ncbi:YigZ family protein [Pseudomonas putida]|uniref:IMPACT family protein n=1 Tax=Pseudomonas putida TaxID=303 RepID=A0AAW6PXY9_PSEPU|nr:YigZ family protein [Pseudomonas putida]KWW18883.1 thymidylate synthase [Pseudomonas putida]MBH3391664.1 YigZ family protein [Pseudomonas putida]MDD1990235.1 IMPACT family protein [Pseudomonas putida]MDF3874545.1 IMPACT family protein [Pseudomonas putida]MDF3880680.1 IMPACT family protein [Pseudomonas putida]
MPSTLLDLCEYREDIRKSRFITLAGPINSAADAMSFIERHSDLAATHNCWAWKLGGQYRSNDDGEPGGTAGRPILAAIEAQDCDQVVVLVIRWYGGIQLGTGGLARAYGGGANKCLQQAPKRLLVQRSEFTCSCSFSELALVKLRLAEVDGLVLDEQFTANGVDLVIALGDAHRAPLQQQLADLSRGRILLEAC